MITSESPYIVDMSSSQMHDTLKTLSFISIHDLFCCKHACTPTSHASSNRNKSYKHVWRTKSRVVSNKHTVIQGSTTLELSILCEKDGFIEQNPGLLA